MELQSPPIGSIHRKEGDLLTVLGVPNQTNFPSILQHLKGY